MTTSFGKNNYESPATKVMVKVYDRSKYEADSQKIAEVEYTIVRWGIFNLKDFNEDDRNDIINNDMLDEYDEYLRIWTKDDQYESEPSTFRNSHVEMFRI